MCSDFPDRGKQPPDQQREAFDDAHELNIDERLKSLDELSALDQELNLGFSDLSPDFIANVVQSKKERDDGQLTPYKFGDEPKGLTVEFDENGDWVVQIPDELLNDGRFREGDEIEIKPFKNRIELINLSCKTMAESVVRRNLNSLMRRLNDDNCHLNRILVTRRNKPSVWLISEDDELKALVEARRNQKEIEVNVDDL